MSAYLDHAATSPIRPEVADLLRAAMDEVGNPSSLHAQGRAARRRVEEAREDLADALGARPSEVVFTSGGTESDNIAVKGLYRHAHDADPARRRIVCSAAEHSAVLDSVGSLVAREGAEVTWVEPGHDGVVTAQSFRDAVEDPAAGGPDTVAALFAMWANNETGVVQPVSEIAQVAADHALPLATDAVQAVGKVPVHFADSGARLMAATGHKVGGPVGAGALLVDRAVQVTAISHGGGQERQLRSGTLAMPLIVAMARAIRLAVDGQEAEAARLVVLRDRLIQGILHAVPGAQVTGRWEPGDTIGRTASHAHVLIPDCEGDALLFLLDAAGVLCSTGSACHAGVPQPSHVLLAMGYDAAQARGALRLTLGWSSTDADVDAVLAALPDAVERAQRAHAATCARAAARAGHGQSTGVS
ncbi:IscS-like cysteine desulfurase [Austwickia sp. TVS 96-490-7B]|uniref:cysteine desulfurase family protein n=1 Tax=Austwickia sp. TVS 96-490-7B TaxID=2830843 RepID=UPI001C57958C|nr:cysteine desulfurase family protein [Austwickia sp. TVS 96-490-7B]MBW3085836.1 IscS-like cysteine desulfurase [Austwickia sp. TVS 96-490-7B]